MNFHELQESQHNVGLHGGSHLGTLLWWSLNNSRIHHAALEDLARKYGLDSRYLPSPVKPVGAFRRAWRHASTRLEPGFMLRQIADTNDSIVVGLVEERADNAVLDLNYTTQARISFDKVSGTLKCDCQHVTFSKVLELYQHHLAHTTQDVRFILSAFVRESGVSLRQHGGTYFIPSKCRATLDAVSCVVSECGQNVVYQLPIFDSPQVKSTLTNVTLDSLDNEILALRAELEGFDDKTRDSTMEKRLSRFDELRSRVALFSGVLSFSADDLNTKIDTVQKGLRAKLGLPAVSEAPPAAAERMDVLPCSPDAVQLELTDDVAGF